jgi:hypothetical protein
MMCEPEERDLQHAARQALVDLQAKGLHGPSLVEAAVEAVAGLWAHVDRAAIRAAVVRCLEAAAARDSA